MTETFDELRIIAQDGGRLTTLDRELIARAADELESALRQLVATQAALIEAQGRRIALNDRLLHLQKNPPFTPAMWVTKLTFVP